MWYNQIDPVVMDNFPLIIVAGFACTAMTAVILSDPAGGRRGRAAGVVVVAFVLMVFLTYAMASAQGVFRPDTMTPEGKEYINLWETCRSNFDYDECFSRQDKLYEQAYGEKRE